VEDADERGAGRRSVGEGNVAVILGDLVLGVVSGKYRASSAPLGRTTSVKVSPEE
jgi:hypothetical protein